MEVYEIELSSYELKLILGALQAETLSLREMNLNQVGLDRLLALDLIRLRLDGLGNGINHSLPAFIEDVQHYLSNVRKGC